VPNQKENLFKHFLFQEKVTSSVTNSSMDKSKIYGMVQMVPNIPINLLPEDATYCITTYSIV